MEIWEWVLRLGCRPANFCSNRIIPPEMLMPILPEIANLVSLERRRDIESEIEYASPPPQYDQLRGERMPPFDEVTLLSGAVDRARKVKALQTIAQKLNDKERKEVAIWAIV